MKIKEFKNKSLHLKADNSEITYAYCTRYSTDYKIHNKLVNEFKEIGLEVFAVQNKRFAFLEFYYSEKDNIYYILKSTDLYGLENGDSIILKAHKVTEEMQESIKNFRNIKIGGLTLAER